MHPRPVLPLLLLLLLLLMLLPLLAAERVLLDGAWQHDWHGRRSEREVQRIDGRDQVVFDRTSHTVIGPPRGRSFDLDDWAILEITVLAPDYQGGALGLSFLDQDGDASDWVYLEEIRAAPDSQVHRIALDRFRGDGFDRDDAIELDISSQKRPPAHPLAITGLRLIGEDERDIKPAEPPAPLERPRADTTAAADTSG
ncbi:MAG: hypothetical protein ACOCXA_08450, partial [Planctomycetota bacterium]